MTTLSSQLELCYNLVAKEYADKFLSELEHKPFDIAYLKHFYEVNQFQGKFVDLGCGPGQTTKFLYDCGCRDITGLDLAPKMIDIARETFPSIEFLAGDMLNLPFANGSVGAILAFYAIVNLPLAAIDLAFKEMFRVLKETGQIFFSFHVSTHTDGTNETVELKEFLNEQMDIVFYFYQVDDIVRLLQQQHFEIIDVIVRYPYSHEHATKRAYIVAQKKSIAT